MSLNLGAVNSQNVRRDSLSTVASSVAATYVQKNVGSSLSQNHFEEIITSSQSNVKINGSSGIQVGDVIYNFYTPPLDSKHLKI